LKTTDRHAGIRGCEGLQQWKGDLVVDCTALAYRYCEERAVNRALAMLLGFSSIGMMVWAMTRERLLVYILGPIVVVVIAATLYMLLLMLSWVHPPGGVGVFVGGVDVIKPVPIRMALSNTFLPLSDIEVLRRTRKGLRVRSNALGKLWLRSKVYGEEGLEVLVRNVNLPPPLRS